MRMRSISMANGHMAYQVTSCKLNTTLTDGAPSGDNPKPWGRTDACGIKKGGTGSGDPNMRNRNAQQSTESMGVKMITGSFTEPSMTLIVHGGRTITGLSDARGKNAQSCTKLTSIDTIVPKLRTSRKAQTSRNEEPNRHDACETFMVKPKHYTNISETKCMPSGPIYAANMQYAPGRAVTNEMEHTKADTYGSPQAINTWHGKIVNSPTHTMPIHMTPGKSSPRGYNRYRLMDKPNGQPPDCKMANIRLKEPARTSPNKRDAWMIETIPAAAAAGTAEASRPRRTYAGTCGTSHHSTEGRC